MQQDKQVQFYRDIASMSGDQAAEHFESFTQAEVHEEAYMEGGTFMPLGAWAAKGFDRNAIETKSLPADVREHPVLGRTYRVRLVSTMHSEKRTLCRESKVSVNLKKKPRAMLEPGTPVEEPLAIEDACSESSSSSSSSSSSDDKKKSKKSKDKQEKKKKKKKDKKTKANKDKNEKKGKRGQVIQLFTLSKHIAANPINQCWSQERFSR